MRQNPQVSGGTTATSVQEFTQIENAAAKASSAVRDAMANFASLCKMVGHPSSGTSLPPVSSPPPAQTGAVGASTFDTMSTAVTGPDTGLAAFAEAHDQAVTQAEESSGKLREIFEDTGKDIGTSFKDTFRDIFETGDADFKKLGKSIVGTLKGSALKIADEFILNPIGNALSTMASAAGTSLLGGFSGMLSGGGGGGFTGGSFGGGGGGLDLLTSLGLGSNLTGGGLFSGVSNWAAGAFPSVFGAGIGATGAQTATGFATGVGGLGPGGLGMPAPSGFSGVLGAAGGGMMGGLGASLLGLGHDNMLINSGASLAGGMAGMLLTPFLGPLGPIVGGFLGSTFAGLFGSKPKTHKAISPLSFDSSTGVVGLADPTVRRGGNLDLSSSGALETASLLNEILGTFDGGITGLPGRVAFFSKEHDKKGAQIITEFQAGTGVGTNQVFSADEQGFKAAVADLTFQTLKAAARHSNQQTLQSAIQQSGEQVPGSTVTTPDGRTILKLGHVPGAGTTGGMGVTSSAQARADSPGLAQLGLLNASDNIRSAILNSVAKDLTGLTSDIDFAMFVDGLDEMPDAITAAQQAINAINKTFDEATERADALGFSLESMEAARARELARLTTDFDAGITETILGFTDPLQLALDKLGEAQGNRLKEAEVLGADLVALEQLSGLERQRVMEQFAKQATNSLEQLLIELKSGPGSVLNAPETLANAESRFNTLVSARQNGEDIAGGDIVGAARNLIAANEAYFGSSESFFERMNFIITTVENLTGDVPGIISGGPFAMSGGGGNLTGTPSTTISVPRSDVNGQILTLLSEIRTAVSAGTVSERQLAEQIVQILTSIDLSQEALTDKIDLALSA